MRAARTTTASVYLSGDPELVLEFGDLCAAAGYSVICPPGRGPTATPPGFRKSSSIPASVALGAELTNTDPARKRKNLAALDASLPARVPILTSAVTVSVGEQAAWVQRPGRLIGCGAFPTLLGGPLAEVTVSLSTGTPSLEAAGAFFGRLGKEVTVVQDRVGLVMPRILCSLINEAFFALTERVAAPGDIDTAMKLGTNHPRGPVEWANLVGIRQIVSTLNALKTSTGEERYRLAPLLQQMSLEPKMWKK